MALAWWAYGLGLIGAGAGGWMLAAPLADLEVATPTSRVSVPAFEREGVQISMALGGLEALGYSAVARTAEAAEAAGPPPIDVAFAFRRDLTAIVRRGARTTIWVVDRESGERRALRRGSVFMDAWQVAAIGDQEIVLRRDGEEKRISIVGPPPAAPPATPG